MTSRPLSADESASRWARTADFATPIRWGDVERAALAQPLPSDDELARSLAELPRIRWKRVVPIAVLMYASPLIALAASVAAVNASSRGAADGWLFAANVALIATFCVGIAPMMIWLDTRQRGRWDLLQTAGSAAAAVIAFIVLRSGDAPVDEGLAPWFALLAAVGGGTAFLVLLTRSRPYRRLPRMRISDLTPQQRWQMAVRAVALEAIIKRGLVKREDVDIPGMVEMPLGSWDELDPPPGEAGQR